MRIQKASAMLITLLIAASATALVLASNRLVASQARMAASQQDIKLAAQAAQNGISAGVQRYNNYLKLNDPITVAERQNRYNYGAYSHNTAYFTADFGVNDYIYRGYTDSNCFNYSPEAFSASSFSQSCPYYGLRIKDSQQLKSGDVLDLTSREIVAGQIIALPIRLNGSSLNLNIYLKNDVNGNQRGNIIYHFYDLDYAPISLGQTGPLVNGAFINVTNPIVKFLELTPALEAGDAFQGIVEIENVGSNKVLMGQGYYSIEATGYSGLYSKNVRLEIR